MEKGCLWCFYQMGHVWRHNCGWEIDHIKPDSKGGEDIISNARPLQWYNNVTRSNEKLTCPVTAKKDK